MLKNKLVGIANGFHSQLWLKSDQIDDLLEAITNPNVVSIFQGDASKWLSTLVFFPFDTTSRKLPSRLSINRKNFKKSFVYTTDESDELGFYLGEYYYIAEPSYTEYEPYTNLQIFLPYYGWVDIPINRVTNKYIQFRLKCDFYTGQAQYIIGVSDTSIFNPDDSYFMRFVDDSNVIIVSTYSFQLGVMIPLGTNGAADAIRNTVLGAIRTVGNLAISAATIGLGGATATTTTTTSPRTISHSGHTSTQTHARFNPETNRPLKPAVNTYTEGARTTTFGEETRVSRSDYSNRVASSMASEAFNNSLSTVANSALSPSLEKSNNTSLTSYGYTDIIILKKKAKLKPKTEEYNHLFGSPLGETKVLSELNGYTEISDIHVEGEAFDLATQEELSMLNEILTAGIIL